MADAETVIVAHNIQSILSCSERDYLVRNNGDQVKIENLKGKKVGLYFSASWCGPCKRFTPTLVEVYNEVSAKGTVSQLEGKTVGLYFSSFSYKGSAQFTPKLVEVYEKLKAKGEDFEIVLISVGGDEESFQEGLKSLPLLALPFNDKRCEKLARYFELSTLPTLVIIGPDGKTLHSNVAETIEEHGDIAYPFTPEKFAELAEIEKAKEAAQTLESILVSGDLDFVLGKDGAKIPVSDLVGKTVLLYFWAQWCPPCRMFLPKLIEAYHKIKANGNALEVVFISSDRDQASFNDFFAEMPWLALPFGDSRKSFLSRKFKGSGIPMLVAIGPSGQTVTKETRELVTLYGAEAYPFTEERVKQLKAGTNEEEKDKKDGLVCDGEVCFKA